MFIAEQFTRDRTWKQLQLSINRAMDKEDVVHIYNGISLSHKKYKNAICSNIDGPRDCRTECSKSDTERQTSYDITYMWNLKKKCTDELIYETKVEK